MPQTNTSAPLSLAVAGRDIIGTGGGAVLVNTVKEFVKRGHNVTVVADYDVSSVLPDIPLHVMPFGENLRKWSPKTQAGRTFRFFLRLFLFSFYGRFQLLKLERKGWLSIDHNLEAFGGNICVMHNVFLQDFLISKRFIRLLSPGAVFRLIRERLVLPRKYVKAIVSVSSGTVKEIICHYRPPQPVTYVHNGVDSARFSPATDDERASFLTKLGFNSEDFHLLFVGHEFKRKGLHFILEALPLLPSHVKLLVVGGRMDNINDYKEMTRRLDIENRVFFLGTRSDVPSFYSCCDAFVFPSSYETFALVVMEAMACGSAVLSTKVCGVEDYLIDSENGLFIERSGKDIADKIQVLMENPALRSRIKQKARETARQYTWRKCAEGYLSVIHKIAL